MHLFISLSKYSGSSSAYLDIIVPHQFTLIQLFLISLSRYNYSSSVYLDKIVPRQLIYIRLFLISLSRWNCSSSVYLYTIVPYQFIWIQLFLISLSRYNCSSSVYLDTGCLKKLQESDLFNVSGTKKQISKHFFSSENWDPYENFEYRTISVQY